MKKCIPFLLFALLLGCGQPAQREAALVERTRSDFFANDLMLIGAYYYPEHWSPEHWERDIKHIADLGFEFTHFGEFAWPMMEPEDGVFDFDWLDTCVALAAKYGLKVIMCTPTPCPPAWLTTKHPEVLVVDDNLVQQAHANRLHANGMNETYQKYAKRIVAQLAQRYGQDERIWGWQLDNEPHYSTLYDYSETAQRQFRTWISKKYTNIANLNKAWGTPFWGQVYNNFEQIRIPNRKEGSSSSPSHFVDFYRFNAEQIASFLRYQAEILKAHVSPDQWITTNFAYYKFLPSVDPFLNQDDLDYAAHTMYLTSTWLNYPKGELAHRLGSGMELSFSNEMAKSVNGYTGIMELQPGQINWGQWNSRPLPGAVRMWLWHAFALDDKYVCTYRFRQPIYGGEQFHEGIVETDGVTVSHGGKEYVQTLNEIKRLREIWNKDAQEPADYAGRRTAFLWKQANLWSMESSKHTAFWDTWQHYYTYYENLKTIGAPVTFIQEKDDFDPARFPFMVAPAHEMVDEALVEKWKSYVAQGGHLILSCRTGLKDNNSHLWEMNLQEPVWDLIGAQVEFYDQLPDSKPGNISFNGSQYSWYVWADKLIPAGGTEVLAEHADQFYAGAPVIVRNKIGPGTVTYIGTWSAEGELEREVIRKVFSDAGAEILDLPRYVFTEWRDGFWVTVNYTSETAKAPVHRNAEILFGAPQVKPGDVCVWRTK